MNLCLAKAVEKSQPLPGDELVASPGITSTHAVSINCSPTMVWPWLVQMGQGRGGFYSYTLLENLIGCQMKNANRIHSQWQDLQLHDPIQLHPKFPPMYVTLLERNQHLLLRQQTAMIDWTWVFKLSKLGSDRCRLLVRSRMFSERWSIKLSLFPVMTLGHYLMERKMLLGIKKRCEAQC